MLWNMARVWSASTTPQAPSLAPQAPSTLATETALVIVDGVILTVAPLPAAASELCCCLASRHSVHVTAEVLIDMVKQSTPGCQTSAEVRTSSTQIFIIPITVINGGGVQMACPGFIDSHVHLLDGGKRLFSVSLRECTTREEFVATIRDFIEREQVPHGEWITGGDWSNVSLRAFPDKSWVDEATTNHLVLLARLDSHCAVVGSRVLDALPEFHDAQFSTPGGTIERDADGVPTGLLKERAIGYVKRSLWPADDTTQRMEKALHSSGKYLQSHGITSVHVMSSLDFSNIGEIEFLLRNVNAAKRLPVRVRAAVRVQEIDALKSLMDREGSGEDIGGSYLSVGMVKFFSDGSLGSRTAAMKKPYEGTCQCGFLLQPLEELRSGILDAVRSGFQCCVHAIGDAAVAHAVDAIADAINAVDAAARDAGAPTPTRRRHRIEHCQHVDDIPTLFPRMAEFDIVASCQPSHLLVDGPYAERELGADRMKGAYCFRSMLRHNVPLAFGSDWMVAPACVLTSIDAAVSRRYEVEVASSSSGEGSASERCVYVWNSDEALTVEEALAAYTAGAAASGHQDNRVGHLRPGYLGDVVVISHDLLAPPEARTTTPYVAYTIINGDVVFSR